ncbi:DUF4286 family protein [Aquamicrobium sp. LC103]|uniref:DUF4286 family protein n=1 Tax=Aquamicrobium sp. LC103 TaxID=1120658 RepID=UPI001FEE0E21|nr:DUF4286 family protein [Aquamicrobium sp. LC103]
MQHIVLVDIDPEVEDDFNAWYDEIHIPDILACPGWLSAKRHRCVEGGPKYVAVYEITGPEAYETPEFHAIKGFGPFEDRVSNFRRLRLAPLEREQAAS